MDYRRHTRALLLIYACLGLAYAGAVSAEAVDTRVLIDISGSMKRTDPDNLRAAALRLVTGLLPSGSQAGVWTFGRYVNMEVGHGVVDDAWRAAAERGAGRIHSRGMFTNIEDALRRATRDWRGSPPDERRNLLLLTDGMVDVSKKPGANDASRERILQTVLPDLQARGINVMTVALSEEADHELLRTLAQHTEGWYESARDAAELQRAFLRAFEKTTDTDALPLQDNRFQVDASISELTLLVFRPAEAPPTLLHAPDGSEYSAEAPPPGARWRADQGYDLITIEQPQGGHWRVDAELDPDNRVLVVTDLQLQTSELANHLLPSDGVDFAASLTEGGQRIERADFLQLVHVFAEHARPSGTVASYLLERTAAHEFVTTLANLREEGTHTLTISASSDTFARERQLRFDVALPVSVDVGAADQGFPVRIGARAEFVDTETLQITAEVQVAGAAPRAVDLVRIETGDWLGDIGELPPGEHALTLRLLGASPTGQPLDQVLPPLRLQGPPAPAPVSEPAAPTPAPVENEFDWFAYIWQVAAANVLALIIVGAWLWLRRRGRDIDAGLRLAEVES